MKFFPFNKKNEEKELDALENKIQRLMRLSYYIQEGKFPPENHIIEVKDGRFLSKPNLEILQ